MSFVGGGFQNTASGGCSVVVGGCRNTASGGYSFVVGGACNFVCNTYGVVVGGSTNCATALLSFVGGGASNIACGTYSAILGGSNNLASSQYSAISAGQCNTSSGNYSFVGGGKTNTASSSYAAVLGGRCNTASAYGSVVLGGTLNVACGTFSAAFGCGLTNTVACSFLANQLRASTLICNGIVYSSSCTLTNTNPSDRTLKCDITASTYGLCELKQLNPVKYKWICGDESFNLGFIAQEVKEVLPTFVGENPDKTLGLYSDRFTPLTVKAVQELSLKVDSQEQRIVMLEDILKRNNLL
jgi:hypothetical protein